MRSAVKKKAKSNFPGISSRAFEHPADRAALVSLRKVPGFDITLRKIIGAFGERRLRLLFLANGVRVSEKQFPRLQRLLEEICFTLDVSEVPELFVVSSPINNAAAIGVDRPFIVMNSSLVNLMSDEELRYVLGHEVGHILAGHSLYKTMLLVLLQMSRWLMGAPLMALSLPLMLALREWERKSELSADRAGLLVTQDLAAASGVVLKLAGASDTKEYSYEEFEKQAKEYKEGGTVVDNIFKIMNLLWMSHPFPVLRVLELRQWGTSEDYHRIVNGDYPKRGDDSVTSVRDDLASGAESYRSTLADLAKNFFGEKWSKKGAKGDE